MYNPQTPQNEVNPIKRIRFWYTLLIFIMAVFLVRLFYLQVIKYDHYKKIALQAQTKEYEIRAERGLISAHDGKNIVPIVLNETRYTLFADPKFIEDPKEVAEAISGVIGGNKDEYAKKMGLETRYIVLAKKLNKSQKEKIAKLGYKGVGTREESYRTYPQGNLAAQLLGFVNDDGEGKYGIEQYLNTVLKGQTGQLKAITDAQGVPLVANENNIITQPKAGERVVLTIDVSMQKQLEDILKAGLDKARSGSGSAVIMDSYSGAVRAMANFPTYNPAEFYKVSDANLFTNAAVSSPLEVGSVMKPLTMAAALNSGSITPSATYFDESVVNIDGEKISNIPEDGGPGTKTLRDILQQSLNTGAVFLLKQMGGGEINAKARKTWHDYMTNHYGFGQLTGIEQGYEAGGSVPDPVKGFGLNIQYANTAFGQGMSATPLQMAAALSSIINGGSYYKPRLVEQTISSSGKPAFKRPEIVNRSVVRPDTSRIIRSFMGYVISKNYSIYGMKAPKPSYLIGGKTGTAEIAKPGGGYYEDRFNGMFIGFVGGNKPQYVVVVRVNEPGIFGYAGARTAAPIFGSLSEMLINNFGVSR